MSSVAATGGGRGGGGGGGGGATVAAPSYASVVGGTAPTPARRVGAGLTPHSTPSHGTRTGTAGLRQRRRRGRRTSRDSSTASTVVSMQATGKPAQHTTTRVLVSLFTWVYRLTLVACGVSMATIQGGFYLMLGLASFATFPTLYHPLTRPLGPRQPVLHTVIAVCACILGAAACIGHAVFHGLRLSDDTSTWGWFGIKNFDTSTKLALSVVPDACVVVFSVVGLVATAAANKRLGDGKSSPAPMPRSETLVRPLQVLAVFMCAVAGMSAPSTTFIVYASIALFSLAWWAMLGSCACVARGGRKNMMKAGIWVMHVFNGLHMVIEYWVQLMPPKPIALRIGFPLWSMVRVLSTVLASTVPCLTLTACRTAAERVAICRVPWRTVLVVRGVLDPSSNQNTQCRQRAPP